MRPPSKVFFLAIFALLGSTCADASKPSRTERAGPDVCAIDTKATVSDACVSYATLDALNADLTPSIKSITQQTDFFAYYRLNLFNRVCPFWTDENSMCGNIACAVHTLDNEDEIPEIWRAQELSKLKGPKAEHPDRQEQKVRQERPLQGELGDDVGESCVVEYDDECDDRDYCVPEDESAAGKGDYVSLVDNPERFTGYTGPGPRHVWDTIYRENCFFKSQPKPFQTPTLSSPFGEQASLDLKQVIKQHARQPALLNSQPLEASLDRLELDDECLEKRVFYRIISGMHASISAHLCWDHLNQTTGQWGPYLKCYEDRLHSHPDRIANLYFNYALVLRAVAKLQHVLPDYTFCQGDPPQDRITKLKTLHLVDQIASGPKIFDESLMFKDPSAAGLKDDFKHRFRNVSRLMDCVGCDKCRLWGKVQTAGYGTALKVLFEFDDEIEKGQKPQLRRTELVALVNTLDRISSSLSTIGNFRRMIEAVRDGNVAQDAASTPPRETIQRIRPADEGLKSPPSEMDDDDLEAESIHQPRTIMEDFWFEWYRMWRVLAFVLRGWANLPSLITKIADDLYHFHQQHFSPPPSAAIRFQGLLLPHDPRLALPTRGEEDISGPDLGYYADGTPRTLTDEQIAIFRHSEIQDLLRAQRHAREGLRGDNSDADGGADREEHVVDDVQGAKMTSGQLPRDDDDDDDEVDEAEYRAFLDREERELRGDVTMTKKKKQAWDFDRRGQNGTGRRSTEVSTGGARQGRRIIVYDDDNNNDNNKDVKNGPTAGSISTTGSSRSKEFLWPRIG
ncbi:MAG: endoplasmic oxidoreductin-1 [Phylliscum demangeonii]|nr:MAG: endoplasmic oxidoreductin-1 [Phylliscum demangeonii]